MFHKRVWFVDAEFTSTSEYPNFKAWFDGDNIAAASLENQGTDSGTNVTGPNYNPTINANFPSLWSWQYFYGNLSTPTGALYFDCKSSEGYSGSKRKMSIKSRN